MSDDRLKCESMSIEEAKVSNMWEIAAIVEVLERRSLCTKQDPYDIITEFRPPRASTPETAFPEPYLLTEPENTIIDDILALVNKHGLTSHQPQNLLERLGGINEMGEHIAPNTMHRVGTRTLKKRRGAHCDTPRLSPSLELLNALLTATYPLWIIASKLMAVCPSILTILLHISPVIPFIISRHRVALGIHNTAAHCGRHYYNLEYFS